MYNKNKNILEAFGNIKIKDLEKNIEIFSDEIIYFKNEEIIISKRTLKQHIIITNLFMQKVLNMKKIKIY